MSSSWMVTRQRAVWVVVTVLVVGSAATPSPRGLPGPVVPAMIGVNTHFTGDDRPQVRRLAAGGFRFIRTDMSWGQIERTRGRYDFAEWDGLVRALDASGVRAIAMLGYGNGLYDHGAAPCSPAGRAAFARFAAAAAARYRGHSVIFEVWNEPNIFAWTPLPNADDYAALAIATAAAVRRADPTACVVGPALAGVDERNGLLFLERCCKLGLMKSIDAVTVHPYRPDGPETVASDYRRIRRIIERYAPAGKRVPIIAGEWGYSTTEITWDRQGQYLARMMLVNMAEGVPLTIWYDWGDDGPDPKNREHNFGTIHGGTPKPAYHACQSLVRELAGCRFVTRIGGREDDWVLLFHGPGGYRLAAWTTGSAHTVRLDTSAGSRSVKLGPLPAYVRLGSATRMTREASISCAASVEAASDRPRDLVSVTVRNPSARGRNGLVELQVRSAHAMRRRVAVGPGGATLVRFRPRVAWDGLSPVNAIVSVRWTHDPVVVRRVVDLGSEFRPRVQVACPVGRVLEVRLTSPDRYRMRGRLRLAAVRGLNLERSSAWVDTTSKATVRFTLRKPAPRRFSVGVQFSDRAGNLALDAPPLDYAVVDDFSRVPEGNITGDYKVALERTPSARVEVQVFRVRLPDPLSRASRVPACRIQYAYTTGDWCSLIVSPKQAPAIPGDPLELGAWVYGDGSRTSLTCRVRDANGVEYEPEDYPIDWRGWRYCTVPLPGAPAEMLEHPSAKPALPFVLSAICCLDNEQRAVHGAIQLGPMMVVSRPRK